MRKYARAVSRASLAIAAGVFVVTTAATVSLASHPMPDGPVSTTTAPSTTVPLATWIAAAEIIIPPVAVVPTRLIAHPSAIEIDYDIVGLVAGAATGRPVAWTLLTAGRDIPGVTEPSASRVVFDVGPGFDPATITGLRLDRYVLLSPIQADFTPSPDDFTAHEIAPGVTAALDIVQPQGTGAIVRVQLATAVPGATADLAAEGRGPGWVVASSNFGGGGLWTLSFAGTELPDPLPLVVRGLVAIPVDTDLVSSLAGVARG